MRRGIDHRPGIVRHDAGRVDLVRGVKEVAAADVVILGNKAIAHVDIVLEKNPIDIVCLQELAVKGIEIVVAGAGGDSIVNTFASQDKITNGYSIHRISCPTSLRNPSSPHPGTELI
jgi:hypothetical protein